MSVVNKMLNDLDKRDAANEGKQAHYQPSPARKSNKARLVIYLALMVLIVVAGLYWYTNVYQTKQPPAPKVVTSTPQSVDNDVSAEPVQVTAKVPSNVPSKPPEKALEPAPLPTVAVQQTETPEPKPAPPVAKVEPPIQKLAVTPSQGKRQSTYQTLVANALAVNNYEQAKQALLSWIDAQPEQLEARKKLASLYFADTDYDKAEALLWDTQSRFPNDVSVRLMQSRLYAKKADLDTAWNVLQLDSNEGDLLHARAALSRQQNKLVLAQQDYFTLTQQDTTDLKAWLGYAVVSQSLGQQTKAVVSFQRVVELAPHDTDIYRYALAQLKSLQEDVTNE